MRTAAIYARVSSDRQKEEKTIASQTEALKRYAQSGGYTVPDEWVFQDEGYSGSHLIRPGLERLRDLSAEGHIETILIYSPDRLSRKYAYQVFLLEEFARHGVEVVFINSPKAETAEEKLLVQFQGMIAEYERAQITERSRRGKKYRAKAGCVNVLSCAPYGYRYVRKCEGSDAYYEVREQEAHVVREIYRLYTQELVSIAEIVRRLNAQGVPTQKGISPWERSVVWGILRNPAYKGTAYFGKTQVSERKRITRPLRQNGGFSPRSHTSCERPKEEWIEIRVPAIINEETFAISQERLEKNKQLSARSTKVPTILQGILVCSICGYAYYRCSTVSAQRKIYYYRCLGSDNHRHHNGRVCNNRPIRQDYLDEIVWERVIRLLEDPLMVRKEIERRVQESQSAHPTQRKKEELLQEKVRLQRAIDKLLDAYQEELLPLSELRKRIPDLRKKEASLLSQIQTLEANAVDQEKILQLAGNIEDFLSHMRNSAQTLDVFARQKIVRLLVKEIQVGPDTITIKHSIPSGGTSSSTEKSTNYLLCKGRNYAASCFG
jgi:site-specific DNA recombinase